MVVDDLHGARIAVVPLENQAPLSVDPNRMESFPAAFQCLEAVARWHAKVAELRSVVQVEKLATCCSPQVCWKAPRGSGRAIVEKVLGQAIAEAPNHGPMLSEYDNLAQGRLPDRWGS